MGLRDLFRPRWTHSNPTVRRTAVEKLDDQSLLAVLATTDPDPRVTQAAFARLNDQTLLAEIAKTGRDPEARRQAVAKVGDQRLLAEVARSDRDARVRRTAVERLAEEGLRGEIAASDESPDVRAAAVESVNDQELLCRIVKSEEVASVRDAALGRLSDQTRLAEIAGTANDLGARLAAVGKLTDQALLLEIARADTDALVRSSAVYRLTDPELLADIALNDASLADAALSNIADQALLARIVRQAATVPVFLAALDRIEPGPAFDEAQAVALRRVKIEDIEDFVGRLESGLEEGNWPNVEKPARKLALIATPCRRDELAAALRETYVITRWLTARALGAEACDRLGDPGRAARLDPRRRAEGLVAGPVLNAQEAAEALADLWDAFVLQDLSYTRASPRNQVVLDIGQRLHQLGGTALMRETHGCFERLRPPKGSTSPGGLLEKAWNGIGGWQW